MSELRRRTRANERTVDLQRVSRQELFRFRLLERRPPHNDLVHSHLHLRQPGVDEEEVTTHPKRPQVAQPLVVKHSSSSLRTEVLGSSPRQPREKLVDRIRGVLLRKAKIDEDGSVLCREKDIGGLDVVVRAACAE